MTYTQLRRWAGTVATRLSGVQTTGCTVRATSTALLAPCTRTGTRSLATSSRSVACAPIENHWTLPLRQQVSLSSDGGPHSHPNPNPIQASRRTGAWGRGFDKHLVVLLPQALWMGNYTAVTCTPRINETLPRLTRALGCAHAPSFTLSHASSHQKGPPLGRRLATVNAIRLSPVACGAVRQLYAQDTALWQRHCT